MIWVSLIYNVSCFVIIDYKSGELNQERVMDSIERYYLYLVFCVV